MRDKWLPAKTVGLILPPAETRGAKKNHADSHGRLPFFEDGNLSRKQEIADSLSRNQLDRKKKIAEKLILYAISVCQLLHTTVDLSLRTLSGMSSQSTNH